MLRVGTAAALVAMVLCSGSWAAPMSRSYAAAAPSQASLENLLVLSGDLPAGLTAGQFLIRPPAMFNGLPAATVTASRYFNTGGSVVGGVSVLVYPTTPNRMTAFRKILADEGPTTPDSSVNPSARMVKIPAVNSIDLLFITCNAIVHIRMTGVNVEPYTVTSYAVRLADRLRAQVC